MPDSLAARFTDAAFQMRCIVFMDREVIGKVEDPVHRIPPLLCPFRTADVSVDLIHRPPLLPSEAFFSIPDAVLHKADRGAACPVLSSQGFFGSNRRRYSQAFAPSETAELRS